MKIKNIVIALLFMTAIAATAQKKISTCELPPGTTAFLEKHSKATSSRLPKKTAKKWREVHGKGKAVPTTFISAMILDCVAENYPQEKITPIGYGSADFAVGLTNKISLQFDESGRFLKSN